MADTLHCLGLVPATKRRYADLREPQADWREPQALQKRRAARARELLAILEGGLLRTGRYDDSFPSASAVVNCVERIESGEETAPPPDHIEARRELTHGWVDAFVEAAPELFLNDTEDAAHLAVADTFDHIGNMRKPCVIAVACTMLALQQTTVDQIRQGVGRDRSLYHTLC